MAYYASPAHMEFTFTLRQTDRETDEETFRYVTVPSYLWAQYDEGYASIADILEYSDITDQEVQDNDYEVYHIEGA